MIEVHSFVDPFEPIYSCVADVVAAAMHARFIKAHILSPAQWEPFRVRGLPEITRDELRAARESR